ncbi:LolA family protein [Salibacterium halotolerans]|uniref:Outer membrane lipoprotein-sorting protein n=1 Tax=Salibacterium halotolerans TaxID=1884432 RepID=A0A1I5XF27_9BACI|nr:outer membrane lipoprotein carrier protein LolA [Salibacterium halotolerans]SFQ30583.1 Outer membrane lipoprotein-sorting protein [Salibacterium halotolerans]
MRRLMYVCFFLLLLMMLAACGEKSQDEVMQDLDQKLQDMNGYKTSASMTLETGDEPRTYDVGVSYMQNEQNKYYKVDLKNENEEQNQMIIRNDDGVFVLTPSLNKSFRFQSDWPNNNSQVYLYESLISDILMDAERTFSIHEDTYVFETKTNYQNKNLHHQEIVLDTKTLAPRSVKIYDADYKELVSVEFSDFEENAEFEQSDFDTERNMTAANMEVSASAGNEKNNEEQQSRKDSFEVVYPTFEPQGAVLEDTNETNTAAGRKVVLTYGGDKPFTIVETPAAAEAVTADINMGKGGPVNLHTAIGARTENSLTWSSGGVEFLLASKHLNAEEMAAVARSMTEPAQAVK